MMRFILVLLCICLVLPILNTGHVTVRSKCNRFWKRVTGHMSDSVLPNRTITFPALHPCNVCVFTYPVGSNYTPVGDYHLIQHYRSKCPIIHENHMTFLTSSVRLTCLCNVTDEVQDLSSISKTVINNNSTSEKSNSSKLPLNFGVNDKNLEKQLSMCVNELQPLPQCVPKLGSIDLNVENLTTFIKSVHKEGQDVDTIQMTAETKNLKDVKVTANYNGLVMKALQFCFEHVKGFYEFLITSAVHNFFATDLRSDSYTITELDKNLTCTLY